MSATGTVVEHYSYDPCGKRRDVSGWGFAGTPGIPLIPTALANLTRGLTGHEHLDRLGLIHMNGWVYDPELGRFLSVEDWLTLMPVLPARVRRCWNRLAWLKPDCIEGADLRYSGR